VVLLATAACGSGTHTAGPASARAPRADAPTPLAVAVAGGPNVRIVSSTGVRMIAGADTCCPAWSPDGHWLGFISGSDNELWITRADGTHRRMLATGVDSFAWSPRSDRLALQAKSGLQLVDLDASEPATITLAAASSSFAWSPDGLRLAVSATVATTYRDQLRIYSLPAPGTSCRSRQSCARIGPPIDLGAIGGPHFFVRIADWRPDGAALVAWVESLETNGRLDAAPLLLVPLDGRRPQLLDYMVVQPDWVRWSPDGAHLALITGTGRFVLDPRRLTVCTASGRCDTLTPATEQARDPEWSPDGRSVLYTVIDQAEALRLASTRPPANWPSLFAHRELWRVALDGGHRARVARVAAGVGAPSFTSDASRLLVVHGRELEQLDLRTGAAVSVAPLVENASTDPYWTSPHALPDDHPYEGVEAGPGGWHKWFAVQPSPA